MSEIKDLAAFFDRHGTINLTTRESGSIKLRVSIIKAKPTTLRRFRDFFGVGSVVGLPQLPPHRYYTYVVYQDKARLVLRRLVPYLNAKREAAEKALDTTAKSLDTTILA